MKLGLDRMQRALEELGRPERCAPAFHVAGTNGKGSVCAMLDAASRAAGLRTGLYTSPHLERFAERFQIDGVPITDEGLLGLYEELKTRLPWAFDGPDALTFFELVTLIGFQYFARSKVDVMVIEVGLGGRLDATNVLTPLVTCITAIGLEHREFLGDTLAAIAGEKAGILKQGVPAVVARQHPEADATILRRAREVRAPLVLEGRDFPPSDLPIGLRGEHQRSNAAVAFRALEIAQASGLALSRAAAKEGIARVRWPGRLETIAQRPEIVLDGAHNPPAADALATACRDLFAGRRIHLVCGLLADKEVDPILDRLLPLATRFIATAPGSPRAIPAADLAKHVRGRVPCEVANTSTEAMEIALRGAGPDDVVLVCGSLYLVGEVRAHHRGTTVRGPGEMLRPIA
jgi:dihydrofolate synthase/folylpolyglutamate synthase